MGTSTEKPAIGQRGMLIRGLDNQLWFRVYDHQHEFVDYDITHYDCEIVIIDPSAALVHTPHGDFLDYTRDSMRVIESSNQTTVENTQ